MRTLYARLEAYRIFPSKIDSDGKKRTIPVSIATLWLDPDPSCEEGQEDFRISRTRGCYTVHVRHEELVRQYRTDPGTVEVEYRPLYRQLGRAEFVRWLNDVAPVAARSVLERF